MIAIFGRLIMAGSYPFLRRGATGGGRNYARSSQPLRGGFGVEYPGARATTPPMMLRTLVVVAALVGPATVAHADVDTRILDAIKKVKPTDYPSANVVTVFNSQ